MGDATVTALERRLSVLDLDEPSVLATLVDDLAAVLEAEGGVAYRLSPRLDGAAPALGIDFVHASSPIERGAKRFVDTIRDAAPRPVRYDVVEPEPSQRNAVRAFVWDRISRTPAGASLERAGIGGFDQLRTLVCDGPELLAWVGGLKQGPFSARARRDFLRLVPALQRRLKIEHALREADLERRSLDAALEHVPSPAFVVRHDGDVRRANRLGETLLRDRGRSFRAELAEAARNGPAAAAYTVERIAARGVPEHALLIRGVQAEPDRELALRLDRARAAWKVTPAQFRVLERLARGRANKAIAAELGISGITVEVHVTALLQKAKAESRLELVAKVWMLQ